MDKRQIVVSGSALPITKEGYLENTEDWSESAATVLATAEHIELSKAHWEVITLIRQFYQEFEHSPAMRILVKYVKQNLGEEKGNSIYLMQLFPGSPAKLAAKIAGLPRPTNCL